MEPVLVGPRKDSIVVFDYQLKSTIAEDILTRTKASAYVILTDDIIWEIYGRSLEVKLRELGAVVHCYQVPPGEKSKSRKTKEMVEDWMLDLSLLRDTVMIALGGGVIGDLCGFIAATYMRGVRFVQIPTSLLAMVDASVGGKTAVNTPKGKNLIGAFHQPVTVYIDIDVLDSISDRQYCNGMAEVIKCACIRNYTMFTVLESKSDEIMKRNKELVQYLVRESIAIKAQVVTDDEKELTGLRGILNFGHTVAHPIETMMTPELLHGECVAIGCVKEAQIARYLGYLHPSAVGRITRCFKLYKLPTVVPPELDLNEMMKGMAIDKKNSGGKIKCVMLNSIGSMVKDEAVPTDVDAIRLAMSQCVHIKPQGPISGQVSPPGSKSISNRILPLAALGNGECLIKGLLHSDDTQRMLEALQMLMGIENAFEWLEGGAVLKVKGCNGQLKAPKGDLYMGNSGTSARFLASIVGLLKEGSAVLTGNPRMCQRPIKDLFDALKSNGCDIGYGAEVGKDLAEGDQGFGCLPIWIRGSGGFNGGTIEMSAKVSSQYVSSLLQAAPYANTPVCLQLKEEQSVSEPYVDMTIQVMKQFGVPVDRPTMNTFKVEGSHYANPQTVVVETDASSGTYPLAIAAVTGGSITVMGVTNNSLQGDSNFCRVLERMGCEVTQTDSSTSIKGPNPGNLKGLGEIDLNAMTDSFMTLCAVAAVAIGPTRIVNIANQRAKECNRIAVMVKEMTKCGAEVRELEDGIEICGLSSWDDVKKLHGARISCHDDHRIAMSFAVLGCVVPGIIITEKACVEKTYPEFWDDLSRLGCVVEAVEQRVVHINSRRIVRENPNIILIGMRGCGKTTLGKYLSEALGYSFVDTDEEIAATVHQPLADYVAANGWDKFRQVESQVLSRVLGECNRTVVSCGGGIVETSTCQTTLKSAAEDGDIILFLHRNIHDVIQYLSKDQSRPSLGESYETIWSRRFPLYESLSNFEIYSRSSDQSLSCVRLDVLRFVQQILSKTPVVTGQSTVLSMTYPDLTPAIPILEALELGVDVLEFRIDLLDNWELSNVRQQYALLRSHAKLPIMWTLRSKLHGGKYEGSAATTESILQLGFRMGADFVDIELNCLSEEKIKKLLHHRHNTLAVISHHGTLDQTYSDEQITSIFQKEAQMGADICKIAIFAREADDSVRMHSISSNFAAKNGIATIGLCMGVLGKMSRVLNNCLTFVTNPLLPFEAAPGQLTVQDLRHTQASIGLLSPSKFFLFGNPIDKSPSPILHNAAFATQGLGALFQYSKHQTTDPADALGVLKRGGCGGASVTIPLKEDLLPLMDIVTIPALCIGAINTISVRPSPIVTDEDSSAESESSILIGDNTDWIGLHRLASRLLRENKKSDVSALVLGSGGTARAAIYALQRVSEISGPVYIYNRTVSRAETLAKRFGAKVVETLEELSSLKIGVIVSTLPPEANMNVPASVLADRPVVIDCAYLPGTGTHFTLDAKSKGLTVAVGLELLFEQATAQSEIWCGRSAPRAAMASALIQDYQDGVLKNDTPKTLQDAVADFESADAPDTPEPFGRRSITQIVQGIGHKIEQKLLYKH